mmetsp:Transcript_87676/g.234747  ORF Transcript_87676/g.234747 Transcript_87676/m.234747 type:complete len:257 (+) Transcript_87676:203-973(+)
MGSGRACARLVGWGSARGRATGLGLSGPVPRGDTNRRPLRSPPGAAAGTARCAGAAPPRLTVGLSRCALARPGCLGVAGSKDSNTPPSTPSFPPTSVTNTGTTVPSPPVPALAPINKTGLGLSTPGEPSRAGACAAETGLGLPSPSTNPTKAACIGTREAVVADGSRGGAGNRGVSSACRPAVGRPSPRFPTTPTSLWRQPRPPSSLSGSANKRTTGPVRCRSRTASAWTNGEATSRTGVRWTTRFGKSLGVSSAG